jgi:hypothetical protein
VRRLEDVKNDLLELKAKSWKREANYRKMGIFEKAARFPRAVFLNRRAAVRYRALGSIITGREIISWNFFSKHFS